MTVFQKAFCIIMSLCFFAALALLPGRFLMQGNVFRQLPLYCFLEDHAGGSIQSEDSETLEKIIEANASYLGEKIKEENKLASREDKPIQEERKEVEEKKEKAKEEQEKDTQKNKEKEMTTEKTEELSEVREIAASIKPHPQVDLSKEALADYDYFLNQFFILDSNTATNSEQLNAAAFLEKDMTVKKDKSVPQILIYHSHSQETFVDSREGVEEDTIVGVGDYLTKLLTEDYGYQVIHITETFDVINGQIDRSAAYDYAREYVEKVLKENPSIEVIIDLHRDGVPEDRHLVTEINGKKTAQIMFYNGLSYTVNNGPVDYLPNPYIQDNLAFSFQLEYQAALYYPELYRGIYLAGLRYNLHLRPKAILLEAGAQTNTVQEVKNAMEPFAHILDRVLTGEARAQIDR